MASRSKVGDIFLACHTGDLDLVRFHVEECEEEVNQRDRWDSTPLYYACLCGHRYVVEYLLRQGARCEPNTFDGERSMYGALTDDIRNLLRSYKVVGSAIARNPYVNFLSQMAEREPADVTFFVHGREFRAHRCVLAARSAYMERRFLGRWRDRPVIQIRHRKVNVEAFHALLTYMYTAQLKIAANLLAAFERLAKLCRLRQALARVAAMKKESSFLETLKPHLHVSLHTLEPDPEELRASFSRLADCALQGGPSGWNYLPFRHSPTLTAPLLPDLCFEVSQRWFLCHRAFFCSRSVYFRALISNQACGEARVTLETQEDDDDEDEDEREEMTLPLVRVQELEAKDFNIILFFVYEERLYLEADASDEEVLRLLDVAEMVLLVGLKRQLGLELERRLSLETVVTMLRVSRLYELARLERACLRSMATNLSELVKRQDFAQLVCEDAALVKVREKTDSIEVVDQLRYQLDSCSEETYEAGSQALHELLLQLDLEC